MPGNKKPRQPLAASSSAKPLRSLFAHPHSTRSGSQHNVRKSLHCVTFIAAVFLTLAQGCLTSDTQNTIHRKKKRKSRSASARKQHLSSDWNLRPLACSFSSINPHDRPHHQSFIDKNRAWWQRPVKNPDYFLSILGGWAVLKPYMSHISAMVNLYRATLNR